MTAPAPLPELHLQSLARTVDHWVQRPDEDPFDLHAPYQRGSVWTEAQRVALVKSIIMGLPVGAVITSQLPYTAGSPHHWRVVDGKQRVEAVRAYLADQLPVPGWWWPADCTTDRAGLVLFSELTTKGQRSFAIRQLPELAWNGEVVYLHPKPLVDGKSQGWVTRRRSADELLVAEAELYGLVNGAGTPQTEADLARARAVAAR